MKTAFGFIDLHGNPSLGKLTERRPLAAVTFLGRYGLIDFALSNFSNSDINKIEILVERNFDSVRSHIQNGNVWVRNTRTGFLRAVMNEKALNNPNANTDIANIIENIPSDVLNEEYVVIASPQFLMSIDYRDVLRWHGDSGAGITVVYAHSKEARKFEGCDKVLLDKDGNIRKFVPLGDDSEADVSLESFVMSKEMFIGLINFSKEISNTKTTIKKMVELYANNNLTKVSGYRFEGYVVPVLNLNQYVSESFKLLDIKNRKQLFLEDWPIYTTTHNTPPALYGADAVVSNSFIANGSIINGKVKDSIISRDVVVKKGANVSNCILFTLTSIGEGVSLQYVVTDKNVHVENVKNLKGDQKDYLLIAKGAKI